MLATRSPSHDGIPQQVFARSAGLLAATLGNASHSLRRLTFDRWLAYIPPPIRLDGTTNSKLDGPMNDPTIICPQCQHEIKLTESLAAPLLATTRREFEDRLAKKDADFAKREADIKHREAALDEAKGAIDEQVAEKLKLEKSRIAAEESKKAKALLGADLEQRVKELADLQEVLKQRDAKLAEAQHAQADLIRKQRELDDQKREMELTLAEAHAAIDTQIAEKLKVEKSRIAAEESKKAQALLGADLEQRAKELADLQEVLKQRDAKLAEAQQAQADLIRKQRELDDQKREMELTIEKRIQDSLATTRDQAKKEAEDGLKLMVQEKEQTINSMKTQIEELKRKAEQGSQQLQGEVQELELETILRGRFPRDSVEPVPKGEHGGDLLQRVFGNQTQSCGTILWESKRTKNWSDGWLAKLRDDQRAAKAEVAVIVSQALPKEVESFDLIDGVWVTSPRTFLPVALMLRQSLLDLSLARQASEGQQTKMEMIYQYLTGPKFRHRIQAVVEKFADMQGDLDKERKTMTKLWAKRQEQIRCVLESTAGMYGDMQGIAGKTLQEIEGLDMPLLEEATDNS